MNKAWGRPGHLAQVHMNSRLGSKFRLISVRRTFPNWFSILSHGSDRILVTSVACRYFSRAKVLLILLPYASTWFPSVSKRNRTEFKNSTSPALNAFAAENSRQRWSTTSINIFSMYSAHSFALQSETVVQNSVFCPQKQKILALCCHLNIWLLGFHGCSRIIRTWRPTNIYRSDGFGRSILRGQHLGWEPLNWILEPSKSGTYPLNGFSRDMTICCLADTWVLTRRRMWSANQIRGCFARDQTGLSCPLEVERLFRRLRPPVRLSYRWECFI